MISLMLGIGLFLCRCNKWYQSISVLNEYFNERMSELMWLPHDNCRHGLFGGTDTMGEGEGACRVAVMYRFRMLINEVKFRFVGAQGIPKLKGSSLNIGVSRAREIIKIHVRNSQQ